MGIWAILQLLVATFSTFATWFPQAVTKYVAENNSKGASSQAAAAFYQALRVNVAIYLPIVVGFFLGARFLASSLLGDVSYAPLFQILAFDLLLTDAIIQVTSAALLGLRMFRETAIVGSVVGGVLRQILIISFIIITKSFVGLVIGWLFSDAVTAGIYMLIIFRVLGGPRFDFPLRRLFFFYLPIELQQIVFYAQNWFDRALLLLYAPLSTLGIYNSAVTAYGVTNGVSQAITKMLLPALSSIRGKTDSRIILCNAIRVATRYACFVVIPLDLLLLATAKPALTLLVGQAYVGAALPLMIFCAADAITVFATALAPAYLAIEETKFVPIIEGLGTVGGVASAYLLLPQWGFIGAAAGRAVSIMLIAVVQLLLLWRKIRLQFDLPNIVKTLIAGSMMALVVALVELVAYSKFLLPLYGLVGVIVYLVMLRLLKAVNKADIDLLQRFLGNRLRPISEILSWILVTPNRRP
jgi:O-antigen/teichoic acid export membrane protein